MAGADRTSIDIVIPSIRLDTERLLRRFTWRFHPAWICRYYIVSDNQDLQSGEFEHNGNPVRVIVNTENLGRHYQETWDWMQGRAGTSCS